MPRTVKSVSTQTCIRIRFPLRVSSTLCFSLALEMDDHDGCIPTSSKVGRRSSWERKCVSWTYCTIPEPMQRPPSPPLLRSRLSVDLHQTGSRTHPAYGRHRHPSMPGEAKSPFMQVCVQRGNLRGVLTPQCSVPRVCHHVISSPSLRCALLGLTKTKQAHGSRPWECGLRWDFSFFIVASLGSGARLNSSKRE